MEKRSCALELGKLKHQRKVKNYREAQCIPDDRAQEFIERLDALTVEFEDAVNLAIPQCFS